MKLHWLRKECERRVSTPALWLFVVFCQSGEVIRQPGDKHDVDKAFMPEAVARQTSVLALLHGSRYFVQREVHPFAVLPGKSHHFIGAHGWTTDPQASIAPGEQAARDRMENLIEHRIADDL